MPDEFEPPSRFDGMGSKVNLFFYAAALVLVGTVLLVTYKQGAFVRHTSIYFYAADVVGINKGMAVKLYGLPVGNVKTMEISDRGVKVELSIVSEYTARVPKGSRARLLREGYIGAANIQIVPGIEPGRAAAPVTEGEVIEFLPNRGVAELIDEMKNQITPILGQINRVLGDVNHPESDFRKSALAARTLLEQLPDTNQAARKLLHDVDRTILTVTPEAQASFGSAARIGAHAEQQLPALTGKLATALDSLTEAAGQVREQTRKNGDALNESLQQAPALVRSSANLVREGDDLVREGREILGAARNIWPLNSAVEPRTMRTLAVDSAESAGRAPRPNAE